MGKSSKPVVIDKEEAKITAAIEAAARRGKGKKTKSNLNYNIAVGTVIAVCVLAVVAALSSSSSSKGNTSLDSYVNDGSFVSLVEASAEGNFTAAASPFFNKWTIADVKWGHAGISLSNMVGFSGAVQVCPGDDDMEGGAIPPSYDARDNWPGCFGDVINSGNCSSSYATAAAEAIAARFCISDNDKYNNLKLSTQQILSCDKKSRGCKGGGVDNVWAYIQRRGLYTEECVPFVGEKGAQCKKDMTKCTEDQKLKVLDHCVLTQKKSLKRDIYNKGPVVAPISLKKDYLVYGSGVYSPTEGPSSDYVFDANGKPVMHAVVILGWGKSHGNPYWIVRHSWGSSWGENGYARVAMDSIVHEGYAVSGTPATEQELQKVELKKADDVKKKEEAKIERAARDERIKANRARWEAENPQAAQAEGGAPAPDSDSIDDLDDDFEAEVDLDADLDA